MLIKYEIKYIKTLKLMKLFDLILSKFTFSGDIINRY